MADRPRLGRHHRRPGRGRRDGRRQPEGRVRDPGLGHAEGDRPDRVRVRRGTGRGAEPRLRRAARRAPGHGRAQGRGRGRDRRAQVRAQADRGHGRDRERRRSLRRRHLLRRRPHRLRGGAVRPGHLRQGPRSRRRGAGRGPGDGRARRRHGRVQRRRRVPADRAGDTGAARPARGADRPAHRLPHLRRIGDPDPARADRARDRLHPPLHPRRPDRHQHDHAAARVDDRPRRRDRLLALHRHPLQTAPARRPVAGGRRRRSRRLGGARRALRRPDRRDLRHGPRLLRPRLRDQARDRLGARRADDGADRQLAADRGAGQAGPQDRPPEGAVPATARRLGGRPRADADRALGTVRDRERETRVRSSCWSQAWSSRRPPRWCASARPTRGRSRTSRPRAAPTTCSPRASGPASTARSRSSSTSTGTIRPAADLRARQGPRGRRLGRRAAVQR